MDTPEINEDELALYDMSDDELEAAFREAKKLPTKQDADENKLEEEEEFQVDAEEKEETEDEYTEQSKKDSDDVEEDDDDNLDSEDEPENVPDEDEADNQPKEKEDSKKSTPQTFKYKANGQDFEFTEDEIKAQFGTIFGQAMNYTKKMQDIAPWRKTISALKDNDLSHDDVNLMIDVLKGDKEAIASIVKRSGIDLMDLDMEEVNYRAKEYGKSDKELAINDVVDVISKDPEYSITQHVVDTQWDARSRIMLANNPEDIKGLHDDIRNGVFDKVNPMAMKLKVLDGGIKPDIEYYLEAGRQYYGQLVLQEQTNSATMAAKLAAEEAERQKLEEQKKILADAEKRQIKQEAVRNAADKRKAAATTTKVAGTRDVIDYLEDSDEAFEDWYKKLQDSY